MFCECGARLEVQFRYCESCGVMCNLFERPEKISVVLRGRNEGGYVKKTVDSLLANTYYPHFEVVYFDDASTDGSYDFLFESPYRDDERIRLLRFPEQQGYLKLQNQTLQNVDGEVIVYLDAHHCFSPYWLSNLYLRLSLDSGERIVGPVVSTMNPDTWSFGDALTYGFTLTPDLLTIKPIGFREVASAGRVPALATHQMMLRRSTLKKLGSWFPLMLEHGSDDIDLCFRAFLFGIDVVVEPSALIGHLHKDSFSNAVTWGNLRFNSLVLAYLNFGPLGLSEVQHALSNEWGYSEGLEYFVLHRRQIEEWRCFVLSQQCRNSEELRCLIKGASSEGVSRSGAVVSERVA